MYLTKFEQDFLRQFLKNAQQAPVETPQVDPQAISNLAKKLINNLSNTGSISASKNDLFVKDLQNLDSLIFFLNQNNVQFDGKFIVSKAGNTQEGDKPDPKFYVPYSLSTGLAGTPIQSQVYIYKDGLIKYLQSLQKQAIEEPNQLLAAMVGRLIDQANQTLQLNMSKEAPKSNQDSNAQQLNDDVDLDRISNPLLLDNPLSSDGNVDVKAKHLLSPEAFDSFVKTLRIKKDGKDLEYQQFTDSTYCDVLGLLHARAESKHYRTRNAYAKRYLDMVEKLMGEYSCPVNKTRPNTDKANSTQDYKPVAWHSGQPLPPNVVKEVAEMRYPLLPDRIDFTWIKQWLQSYEQIENQLGNQLSPAFPDALKFVSNLVNFGFDSQDLNDTAEGIYRAIYSKAVQSVPPQQAIHLPLVYLRTMMNMLVNLKAVLNSFKRDFWYGMHPEWQSEFNTQINGTTNSYAERSILQVQQWINSLPSAQTKVDKELG